MGKFKTRQQLAIEYEISCKTLMRWLKRYNIEIPNGLISPKSQEKIYGHFGEPKEKEEK